MAKQKHWFVKIDGQDVQVPANENWVITHTHISMSGSLSDGDWSGLVAYSDSSNDMMAICSYALMEHTGTYSVVANQGKCYVEIPGGSTLRVGGSHNFAIYIAYERKER